MSPSQTPAGVSWRAGLSLWLTEAGVAEPWVGELLTRAPNTLGAPSVPALGSMLKHIFLQRGNLDSMSDMMLVASGKGLTVGAGWLWMSVQADGDGSTYSPSNHLSREKPSRHARALTHSLGPEDQSTGHQTHLVHKLAMNYWLIVLIFKFISK